jgi:shikimate kinase
MALATQSLTTLDELDLQRPQASAERAVFLIGLMGAGKTTIGQLLAKRLNLRFLDTDHVLEERTGVSVSTMFEVEGEAAFRAREVQVINELTTERGVVLSTGGGVVGDSRNRERLHTRGFVIYLHTSPETAFDRIRRKAERPLLRVVDPLAKLRSLYAIRHPLYEQTCHVRVESYRDRPQTVVTEIHRLIALNELALTAARNKSLPPS